MPFFLNRRHEAVVRLVGRMSVCSEMREHYARAAFDTNFPTYYAHAAFSEDQVARLREFLKTEDVYTAMETINGAMHDFGIKFGCPYIKFRAKPAVFWRNLIASLLVLGSFGWMTMRSGFDPVMLLGIVPALVILVYALRYDWL